MAFWTRFIKRKSNLLDAQEKDPGLAGFFKSLFAFLIRQKPFWISIGLTLTLIIGGTYWAVKVRPYLLEKKAGLVIEGHAPVVKEVVVEKADTFHQDLPEIQESMRESKIEAVALLRLAETHFQSDQVDLAKDELMRAIGLTSDTGLLSTAYANLANLLTGEGKYSTAERYLQRALTFDRHFAQGYHNLGIVYSRMHDYEKAQLAFNVAIREKSDFAQAHAGLGEILATTGKYAEAITSFTESLRLREDPMVRLNLGLAYLQSGNHAQAMEQFTAVQNSSADPYTRYLAFFNRGYTLEAKGRHDEAAADYRAAVQLSPKDVDALFNLGLAHMVSGQKEEALQQFLRVIEFDKDNMDAYMNAVTLHSDLGQYQAAYDLLKPVQERLPDHRRVNFLMANLLHRLGKLGDSHDFFNRVLLEGKGEIPPELRADALSGLGAVFDDSGDLSAAESMYREALRMGKNSYVFYNLARTLRRNKKYEESVKEALQAVEMDPASYSYTLMLAECFFDAENLTKAFEAYKTAAEMSPKDPYPRFKMAYTASRQQLWSTALSEYNRLLTESSVPEVRGAVLKGIGNVYHEQGEFEKALVSYREATAVLPKDSSLFYNMARTYFQMGRMDESYASVQKSIQFDDTSSEAWTLLGTYYFKKGLIEKAYGAFDKAVQLNPENIEAYYNRDIVRKYQ